jgi:hypothetical protein
MIALLCLGAIRSTAYHLGLGPRTEGGLYPPLPATNTVVASLVLDDL